MPNRLNSQYPWRQCFLISAGVVPNSFLTPTDFQNAIKLVIFLAAHNNLIPEITAEKLFSNGVALRVKM
jgi:hypothetical protein